MRVQLIDTDLYDGDDDDYECSTCFGFNAIRKQQTLNSNFKKQPSQQKHQKEQQPSQFSQQVHKTPDTKDLVGNSKEFRIENNKCNLRIIGNGNRIRMANNSANIQIIGNNTRLKITKNSGYIKYTGNEGRICLGNESTQQTVDYIGCNGLLKVVNSTELNKSPKYNKNKNHSSNITNITAINNNLPGNSTQGTSPPLSPSTTTSLKSRVKSASFDELDRKDENWQHFNNFLQHEDWQHVTKVSLPNLKENLNEPCNCNCKCKKIQNKNLISNLNKKNKSQNINRNERIMRNTSGINISNNPIVINAFGDVIINNSVNVSIA